MKAFFQKVGSAVLAVLVVFSTLSFSVGMHYCGDHLVDFGFFDDVSNCGMKPQISTSALGTCTMMEMEMNCCTDFELIVEGQDELKFSFDKISVQQQPAVAAFVCSYIDLIEGRGESAILFKEYSPPVLIRDILILDQTFLI